jgi:HEAT repeat protein
MATLQHLLKDLNENVRADAAEALGNMGPAAKSALPALRQALTDEDDQVRSTAEEALRKVQRKP